MLLLIVGPELDLALEASELTGLVEGDGVGAVQDVVSCLRSTEKGDKCCVGSGGAPPRPCLSPCRPPPSPLPARREGSAGRGHGSPRSGLSRRTSSGAEASRAPPPPAPSGSGRGPASSLGHRGSPQCPVPAALTPSVFHFLFLHVPPSPTNTFHSMSVGLGFSTDAAPECKQCLAKENSESNAEGAPPTPP